MIRNLVLVLALIVLFITDSNAQEGGLEASIKRGKSLYTTNCTSCHMQNGQGVPNAFPPLANSDYLLEDADRAIRQIKNGMQGELVVNGKTYNGVMTPFPFSDQELADVMNYINKSWGNEGETVTKERVAKALSEK